MGGPVAQPRAVMRFRQLPIGFSVDCWFGEDAYPGVATASYDLER